MNTKTHDPFDINGQELSRLERDERNKHEKRVEVEDIKWFMKSRQGRRVMWRLLERAGVFRSSFTGNNETFFREGMRNVGLMYLAQIHEHCADQYILMVQEHNNARPSTDTSRGTSDERARS